eukprot:FR738885.1.p1 GENE.FR738885.1~~FR738885.1.p1  ORF type:complete len:391 (+),score=72.97 FR738885.1:161-1174(+)
MRMWYVGRHLAMGCVARATPFLLACAAFLRARIMIMAGTFPTFSPYTNPVPSHPVAVHRWITGAFYVTYHWWLLFWPAHLSPLWNYYVPELGIITSLNDGRNLCTLVGLSAMLATLAYCLSSGEKSVGCTTAFSMGALYFVPCSSIFFPVGFQVAERVMFMPSMGLCALAASVVDDLLEGERRAVNPVTTGSHRGPVLRVLFTAVRRAAFFGLMLVVIAFSRKTYQQAACWQNRRMLWESAIRSSPGQGNRVRERGQLPPKRWQPLRKPLRKFPPWPPKWRKPGQTRNLGPHLNQRGPNPEWVFAAHPKATPSGKFCFCPQKKKPGEKGNFPPKKRF